MPRIEHVWWCDVPHVRLGHGHVVKRDDLVVGQMHAIDARTGRLLWARRPGRPDTVIDVTRGVMVAGRARPRAPGHQTCAAYGVDARTGQPLWCVNHTDPLLHLLGHVADSLALVVLRVRDGEVFLSDGSVLDAHTGRVLRNILRDAGCDRAALPGLLPEPTACAAGQAFLRLGSFTFPDEAWVSQMEAELSVVPGLRRVGIQGGSPMLPDWEWRLRDPYGARVDVHAQRLLPVGIFAVVATDGGEEARLFAIDVRSGRVVAKRLEASPALQSGRLDWRIEDAELGEVIVSHASPDGGPGTVHLFRLQADPPLIDAASLDAITRDVPRQPP